MSTESDRPSVGEMAKYTIWLGIPFVIGLSTLQYTSAGVSVVLSASTGIWIGGRIVQHHYKKNHV